ncbi:MAG: (2Fe-2S) ferredoxin domain-containing protein [Proteobacteria bacterium]|nr:(2Fe-2S) ferredoxin domain-containing protein [Pseudomonadota bacterium]
MPSFQRHLFVCLNERAPGHPRGCCKHKGSEEVRNKFKREVSARGLRGIVRANKAGCLDQCEHGVTVVVYPEQVWYGGVTVEDVSEIIDRHIIGGEYVTRLMLPDQPHLDGATSSEALDVPEPKPTGQANETAAQSDKGDDRKPT